MADGNPVQLRSPAKPNVKTWVLTLRFEGKSVNNVRTQLYEARKWKRFSGLTHTYVKDIADEKFSRELQRLREFLPSLRAPGQARGSVTYMLTPYKDFNEVGDPIEGLHYLGLDEVE